MNEPTQPSQLLAPPVVMLGDISVDAPRRFLAINSAGDIGLHLVRSGGGHCVELPRV